MRSCYKSFLTSYTYKGYQNVLRNIVIERRVSDHSSAAFIIFFLVFLLFCFFLKRESLRTADAYFGRRKAALMKLSKNRPLNSLIGSSQRDYLNVSSSIVDDKKKRDRSKFKNLTKKQRKKIRMTKANRIVYPFSRLFDKYGAISRKVVVLNHIIGRQVYVHDGYSWDRISVSPHSVGRPVGCMSIKTRPLSPINFFSKGQIGIKMAQSTTYKIKNTKIKRKK